MVASLAMSVVALDLGTSNAVAAVLDGGRPTVVPLLGGALGIPSVVAIDERGRWLVGRDAKAQLLSKPDQTIVAMKTFLGRDADSAAFRVEADELGYGLGPGPNGPMATICGEEISLIEASGLLLRELRGQAQDSLGKVLDGAVLPVPAYFTDEQRQAFADAAYLAGLEKVSVVDETKALSSLLSARRSTPSREEEKTVFLYGLGGGVFDAALLEREERGGLEIVATSGEDLGGSRLDRRIAKHLKTAFWQRYGEEAAITDIGRQRLLEAAEAAKIHLDDEDEAFVSLPCLSNGSDGGPLDLESSLAREDLIRLTGDLILQTVEISRSVLRAAGLDASEIDGVYLYGRAAKSREVQAAIARTFGKPAVRLPDDATALGAAVMAGA